MTPLTDSPLRVRSEYLISMHQVGARSGTSSVSVRPSDDSAALRTVSGCSLKCCDP
jgi:hypothetical protein